jgi:hypothetical protein
MAGNLEPRTVSEPAPQQNVIDAQPQRAYTHLLMRLSLLLLFVWLNLTPSFALAASLNTICLNTELSLLVARVGGKSDPP